MNCENILPNVKRLAKQNHILMRDVESSVGVSAGYLSRKASCPGEISVRVLFKLAEALNTTPDDLLSDPPSFTNADKFTEVFGIPAPCLVDQHAQWWDEEYKTPEEV